MRSAFRSAAAFAVAGMFVASSQAMPSIHSLGTLAGGNYSAAFAVNASGQTTGESNNVSEYDPDNLALAYLSPATPGAMTSLGRIGGAESIGYAINNAGQVAGKSSFTAGNGDFRAFRYVGTPGAGGVMQNLGTLGGTSSEAYGINNAGVVAGYSLTTNNALFRAFRYTGTPGVDGVMQDLGTVVGGIESQGYAINQSGQVTGYSSVPGAIAPNRDSHVFRSGPTGSGSALEDLGTLGGTTAFGLDISDAGRVVGYSYTADNGPMHAFRSGANGNTQLVDLGTLGGPDSEAHAINNAGDVVGNADLPGEISTPFLYLGTPGAGGEMIDLNAYLDRTNPVEGAKWYLTSANDINDVGQIVGTGLFEGEDRAFILNIGPTTWRPGDADRDRDVDFDDLLKLAQNYGTTTAATWSQGNFTADGAVNFDDLLLMAQNYGRNALTAEQIDSLGENFAGDFAMALSLAPEPGVVAAFSLLLCLGRRR